MKNNKNSSSLASSFAAWRKRQAAASLGALSLCSLSTVKAVEQMETESAARFASEKATERATDDSTATGDEITLAPSIVPEIDTAPAALGCLLSRAEREELESVRPASVAVVFRRPAPAPVEISEPLPADFAPVAVPEFSPAMPRAETVFSPAELAEIDAEIAAELAEIDRAEKAAASIAFANAFRSDYKPRFAPVDFAPLAVHFTRKTPANPVCAPSPVETVSAAPVAEMDFAALRAAILSRPTSARRKTTL